MSFQVSIVRYDQPLESVRRAVELARGLDHLPSQARVFIKPNIVFWTRMTDFPKWGVLTTSRVVEDMVVLLKEHGVRDITIGEGVVAPPKDTATPAHAFTTLGYETLHRRYGVRCVNVMERPFAKVDLGGGVELNFNVDILESDFVVDLPPMKTHNQTVVSLGIKNLKGTIDMTSRKVCHSPDPERDLNFHVARLADRMPPMLTVVDGIYSLERGPAFDGRMHRSNLLVASADVLSADMVASTILGHPPGDVPHLALAAANRNRPCDLSDLEIVGERIEEVGFKHEHDVPYSGSDQGDMPVPLARDGIEGLFYRKFDLTLCTYCSMLNGLILSAIRFAWTGQPWDRVEILTGKAMEPTPGMHKTILVGQCMTKKHRDNPVIQEAIPIKGCPPDPEEVVKALHQAGIQADPKLFEQADMLPGLFMSRYEERPEFEESFFRVAPETP